MERKKAEVRKRLEEASKAKQKAKKGFMTPERKKKLRVSPPVFIVYSYFIFRALRCKGQETIFKYKF